MTYAPAGTAVSRRGSAPFVYVNVFFCCTFWVSLPAGRHPPNHVRAAFSITMICVRGLSDADPHRLFRDRTASYMNARGACCVCPLSAVSRGRV